MRCSVVGPGLMCAGVRRRGSLFRLRQQGDRIDGYGMEGTIRRSVIYVCLICDNIPWIMYTINFLALTAIFHSFISLFGYCYRLLLPHPIEICLDPFEYARPLFPECCAYCHCICTHSPHPSVTCAVCHASYTNDLHMFEIRYRIQELP